MMNRKLWCLLGSCLLSITFLQAQNQLTIDTCYALAQRNYPLVQQYNLIEQSRDYSVSNANKGYLPQIYIAGQASYQSEVTSVPNQPFPEIAKDQYRLYGEVSQPITDLFVVKNHKELAQTNAVVEQKQYEVELYKLKDRINQIYFGILLFDAQIQQTILLKKDLVSGIEKTKAAQSNGIATQADVDLLQAEILKANQKYIELNAGKKSYIDMFSLFVGTTLSESTVFEVPQPKMITSGINRPELQLFEMQKRNVDIRSQLINDRNLPKFNLFFQGGIGRPALNMLSNDAEGYYIGGLKLSWNISGFYTSGNEKQLLNLNQNSIDVQKDIFLFNTNLIMTQQNAEANKLSELIASDNEIINLRTNIKNRAKNQLENGVVTTNDYLTYVNAEDQAKQNQLVHQIQLLMAQYNYQTTSGN